MQTHLRQVGDGGICSVENQRLLLLGFDPRTDHSDAKVIVAHGNPDTADNVTIYIPVANTNVAGIDKDLDRMRDLKREADESPDRAKHRPSSGSDMTRPSTSLSATTDR